DLIDAGGGASRALFLLTQTDPLRIYVNVPQSYAQLVQAGQKVTVSQPELAGRNCEGKVARTAAAIDSATRTMQVEIGLPNRDNALLPGAY
ncbi:efflux transporter periplasmic adaptor subunit, partial [Escherichia coli]|uniref:efflux RND transporter periplasmic adaptor subunit n=1 Tax=Escherichia coli TaxID=562 RepID=UPI000CB78EB5